MNTPHKEKMTCLCGGTGYVDTGKGAEGPCPSCSPEKEKREDKNPLDEVRRKTNYELPTSDREHPEKVLAETWAKNGGPFAQRHYKPRESKEKREDAGEDVCGECGKEIPTCRNCKAEAPELFCQCHPLPAKETSYHPSQEAMEDLKSLIGELLVHQAVKNILLEKLNLALDHAKAQAWLEGYNAHTREDDTGISAKNPYAALSLARKEEGK